MPKFQTVILVHLESENIPEKWLAKRFKVLQEGFNCGGFKMTPTIEPTWKEIKEGTGAVESFGLDHRKEGSDG